MCCSIREQAGEVRNLALASDEPVQLQREVAFGVLTRCMDAGRAEDRGHQLRARAHVELIEQRGGMRLDRPVRSTRGYRRTVGLAAGDKARDFGLPGRQRPVRGRQNDPHVQLRRRPFPRFKNLYFD
jgi:hypothetical protein